MDAQQRLSWSNWIFSCARWLAVAGGGLAIALALMVTVSTLSRWLVNESVPGDIELVQMATALAAFCFLPYCQIRRGNIFVETFTMSLSKRAQSLIDAVWDFVYAAVACLMGWQLAAGAWDAISTHTISLQLGISFGYLIFMCAIISGFLGLAALATALSAVKGQQ